VSLNYDFVAEQIGRLAGPNARALDFGCGEGQIVAAARELGHDAYGCDAYPPTWAHMAATAVARDHIRWIGDDGLIPFPDGWFDIVTANQVFEHIPDFTKPLAEISRVLKPGGLFLNMFPTREVWREGHCDVPFAHRFLADERKLRRYLTFAHRLGFGRGRDKYPAAVWAEGLALNLRRVCFYKPRQEVEELFARSFELLPSAEPTWFRHRIAHHRVLRHAASVFAIRAFDPAFRFLSDKLAGRVFVLKKRAATVHASGASTIGS
jgi:SAM-dependent methyltransferase